MTTIALLSDIHGNAVALSAALAAIEQDAPDQIICLGDVIATGPQPHEALARLRALDCPVIMGNTDAWALDPTPYSIRRSEDQLLHEIELWGAQQLTPDEQTFLRTFQPTIELDLGHGRSLLCCHGSPRNFLDVIRATTPDDELAEKLDGRRATVIAGGHTHTPLLRRYAEMLIVNPGSVGMPYFMRDGQLRKPVWAEYALLRATGDGLDITFRQVPYAFDALQTAVSRSAMPHQAAFLAPWIRDGQPPAGERPSAY